MAPKPFTVLARLMPFSSKAAGISIEIPAQERGVTRRTIASRIAVKNNSS